MTSVGVISCAVARIKRLKELQRKDYPETTPFDADGVLERLEKIKGLLVTAYKERTEEGAEVEIKEVVRLSYEIVNVIVDSFNSGNVLDQHWAKGGNKKLREVEEKLAGLQDKLTKKIRPEISAGAPSEVTASQESSADSPRSKNAGRHNKLLGRLLSMFLGNKPTAKNKKSTAGSDSDPMVGSKSPVLKQSTVGSDSDPMVGSKSPVLKQSTAGSDSDPMVGSKSPVLEQSTAGSHLDPLVESKAPVLEQSTAGSDSNPLVESKAPVLEQSTAGSDSNPLVESNAPVLEQSTNGSESREENLEINIEGKSPSTTGSDPLVGSKSPVLEQSTAGSDSNKAPVSVLMDQIKEVLVSKPQENHSGEVYISGKRAMGKGALAKKLYNDPDIRKSFEVFGWVTVGHNFQIKRVLKLLLQQLQGPQQEQRPDLREMNEMELISQIFYAVKDKSYLLVLEEVGSMKDWESISLALPLTNSTRVIITTSSDDFSSCAHHYRISGLTQLETLALWNKEGISFDPKVGKAIYEISGGSELYATILGKSLEAEAKDKQLIEELDSYKPKRGTPRVLNASYRRLAPELKPCFLYLGQFPPFQDIQVDKLYLLLLTENLITSLEESEKSPDHDLKEYLDKLADLKLVEVEEDVQSISGLYKSCRLHDQVQEFCISKGLDEEFLEVVDFKADSKQDVGSHTRRLAIDMRNYRGGGTSISFKGNASVKKILSLLVFDAFESAEGKSGWPSGIGDLTEFTRLRVLSFDKVNFKDRKLPKGLEKLLLLRYLSFRGCFLEELPSSLSKLTQLETLNLLVRDNCCMIIPSDDIFTRMKRMVHLYLPRQYRRKGETKLRLQGMETLETLINFHTEIFEARDLDGMKKLKVLSTISNGENSEEMESVINLLNKRASQLQHSSVEIRSFECYDDACSSALKKLLQCGFVDSVRIEGEIWELPEEGGVGERVAEMVLRGSEMENDLMGYLAKFQNLRSLVLADDAFVGTDIVISSSSAMFPKLRSLKLRNLQYLEKLTIKEEEALPELLSLQIESCGDALELTIAEGLYHRLKNVTGGGNYWVVPPPSKFITTP